MATEREEPEAEPEGFLVQMLDPCCVEITIPGQGEIRVMRYWDADTKSLGVRVVNDLPLRVPFSAGN